MTIPVFPAGEYVKKPVRVPIVQWWPPGDHRHVEIPGVEWRHDHCRACHAPMVLTDRSADVLKCLNCGGSDGGAAFIKTREANEHKVQPGDLIATGVKGEKWAIGPDIFAQTYEPAPSQETTR